MARAEITVKTKNNDGDIHSVEIFFIKGVKGIYYYNRMKSNNKKIS